LFEITGSVLAADGIAEKWLMDPPREGAFALVKALVELVTQDSNPTIENPSEAVKNWQPPKRIVYVSCNPATLARDAGLLGQRSRLHLHRSRRGQHVPSHRACGVDGGV
jgi:23S rRNA (uracil1939-C5)-methyltransferase